MTQKRKVIVAWSGGKDSALALHALQQAGTVDIVALLTTITEEDNRISIHGIRRDLLRQQAESLDCFLQEVFLPPACPNDIYQSRLQEALKGYRDTGVSAVAFGDLFLEDIRVYRENHMHAIGMQPLFPLWLKNTAELARKFIRSGFRAVISSVDTRQLAPEFSGREYDEGFLEDLPGGADPCGENGEFHTFVYDGPNFKYPVPIGRGGKTLQNNRFYCCDLQ